MLKARMADRSGEGDTLLKYEYEFECDDDSAAPNVVRMVTDGGRVLDLGAGPGSITSELKHRKNCHVVALDIDQKNVERLGGFCDAAYQVDLNDPDWPRILADEGPFDTVVATDVLEHLYDPWAALRRMRDLIHDEGEIVLSLPHVGHCVIMACLINEDFEYREEGLLDRTHIRFFGLKNVQALIDEAGLDIVDAQFVVLAPESTELFDQWNRLPPASRKFLSSQKYSDVYQIIVKAKKTHGKNEKIDIYDLIPPNPNFDLFAHLVRGRRSRMFLRGLVKPLLSRRVRQELRRRVKRLGIHI